jgi:tRNA threonylcarbamoyladenosine modification (KEOPS) complex  Pcc1 subunit
MQVRETVESSSTLLSLTTENSRIALGGTAGTITLTVTAADTAAVVAGHYVYDLELVSGSTVYRLVQGCFTVDAEVTR